MNNESEIINQQNVIDNLNNEAWKYRVQDSAQALKLSKKAVLLAVAINYTKGKAEGYRGLGFSYIRLSQHKKANALLGKSLSLFKHLEDLQGQSDVYEYLGIIKRSLGDYRTSLEFLFTSLELRKQTKYLEGESLSCYHLGVTYKYLGNYDKALNYLFESLSIAQTIHYWVSESYALNLIGLIYSETGAFAKALKYYHQSLKLRIEAGDKWGEAGCLDNIGLIYFKLKDCQKAIEFCTRSLTTSIEINDKKGQGNSLFHLGDISRELNNDDEARKYGNKSLKIRREIGDKKGEAEILLFLAELPARGLNQRHKETLLGLLGKALILGHEVNALDLLSKIHFSYYSLYKLYECFKDALSHLELFIEFEKKLHKEAVSERIQNLEITHRAEQSKNEAEIYRLRNIELVELYEESKRQKEKIEEQKRLVEESFIELKSTQKQLVQREKMASLGELTAGIAHEIQNPLNFVNNFSEVSAEMMDEMQKEFVAGNKEEGVALALDIKQNLDKILHHGKRADAIVKGMLMHSRSNSGVKELTNINALADEYLRLAYHGLRAKDKSFNAILNTDYDETIPKINIISQDMGRVILNLITNAFYVVDEKKQLIEGFEPTIWLNTKKVGDKVLISVKDNGNGIPQKIIDKIFQPFFTTKPAGQGTGLGLSLSYDIVKAHGGELKVNTKEDEGSEFVINLPVA
ncbi:MAG: tetratricopeptide repeat protein [Flavobacterium sp.]|nr:tetratricopeptide repeat protein [Pedobacter sp.]